MSRQEMKKTVLVIDDEDVIRNLMKDVLEMLGYNVLLSSAPEDALELYRLHSESLDLILMDMMMPGMNGPELYSAMNEIDDDNKVIVLSGYSMAEEVEQMIEDGVIGFVQKPVTISRLKEVISEALDE